jgi:TonB family protein
LRSYIKESTFKAAHLDPPKVDEANFQVRGMSDAESLAVRADLMAHDRHYTQAQEMLEEALKIDPKLVPACESMSYLYLAQTNMAEAEKWASQAVTLNPQSFRGNYYTAVSLTARGLRDEQSLSKAESSLHTVLKIHPEFAPAYDLLAYVLSQPGPTQRLDDAYMATVQAVYLEPSNITYRIRAVDVLEKQGRADDAISVASRGIPLAATSEDRAQAEATLKSAQEFQAYKKEKKEFQEAQASAQATPGNGASTSEQMEIISDTMGVDFGPYLNKVRQNVRQNWNILIPEVARAPIMKQGKVAIEFAILKDGNVAGMKLVGSSTDIALDRAAWGSISNSNPFPPLPTEFGGQYLALRFTYAYNEPPTLLAPLVEDVQKKLHANISSDNSAKTDLENDVAALTKFLEAGKLDSTDEAVARYFRASAWARLAFLSKQDGMPANATAEQALGDLDRVIASKRDVLASGITIPEVEYMAGGIAAELLSSDLCAYPYWQRCADSNAACMVNLGLGYVVGWEGVQPDAAKALNLSLKAFDTGTRYLCAGAFAARNIAALIYFTGTPYPKDSDPVSWVQKSYAFSDLIDTRYKSKGSCFGSNARIEEFLYRLARGDRQKDLLAQAQHLDNGSAATTALINYFSGSSDVNAFEAAVESSKPEVVRCDAYFKATWYAYLSRDTTVANKFNEQLLKFDHFPCRASLVFAKKFHPEGVQGSPVATQH